MLLKNILAVVGFSDRSENLKLGKDCLTFYTLDKLDHAEIKLIRSFTLDQHR